MEEDDDAAENGLKLMDLLDLDQYNGPKQATPSGGYHFLFYVDEEQKHNVRNRTGLIHEGIKYNADVKFENGLCNCEPSEIDGYGKYKWIDPCRLLNIPQLPDVLYDIIKADPPRKPCDVDRVRDVAVVYHGGEVIQAA